MEMYKVHVATGTSEYSGTNNYIYVTLVGERGESERTLLDNPGLDFCRGAVDEYVVRSARPLGELLLVRLEKQRYWVEDNWFCQYVRVEPQGGSTETQPQGGSTETQPQGGSTETQPQGGSNEPQEGSIEPQGGARVLTFPCYRWLIGDVILELREGTAQRWCDDTLPLLRDHRKSELQQRQNIYRWLQWAPGIPKCIDASSEADLHQDVRFHNEKRSDFEGSLHYALIELSLKKFAIRFGKSWDDLDDFKRIFWKLRSPIAEYVMDHWKEDWFFGYQCLNGCNPRMIHRIHTIPHNFPVTADMVQGSLDPRSDLHRELKAGNVYLVDYAVMDGITANVIRGKPQHIAAPLCLLYQHPDNGLVPIAIQLGQTPGLATPIFLPRDPPLAWLLAKMWVRHAEFQVFQVLSHLLRTHLVVEVFCVATLRQLPAVHPVYKLLAPHLRYTLEINCRGRTQLISNDGIFKRVVSTGGEGLVQLSQREYRVLKYTSLQPRHDFTERGVDRLPKYYYREHSLMLWDAIYSFVSGMVEVYYATDREVSEDPELQAWITDVTKEGFSDIPQFGLSSDLSSRKELSTLLSVVIFCSTAQHAATNNGQFDWCAWVPNTPCTMRHAPPSDKDAVTMEMIMDTLPDVSQSCLQMAITWHLGRVQPDAVPLGQYTEQYFTEPRSQVVLERFRAELKDIEDHIVKQSEGEELKYHFLLPSNVENSITI